MPNIEGYYPTGCGGTTEMTSADRISTAEWFAEAAESYVQELVEVLSGLDGRIADAAQDTIDTAERVVAVIARLGDQIRDIDLND